MPGPRTTTAHISRRVRALTALSTTLLSGSYGVSGTRSCRLPRARRLPTQAAVAAAATSDEPSDIQLEMDTFEATRDGQWNLKGDVSISQGDRTLKTSDATYDPKSQSFSTESGVSYADPAMKVEGTSAQFEPGGGVTFEGATFELPAQPARGVAERIHATRDGELSLDGVRYTSCPVGNDDWMLKASDIDISQQSGTGTGRNVRLDFKGIPILYTPIISFPVGDQRKSGFLFPSFGTIFAQRHPAQRAVVLEHRAGVRRDIRTDVVFQTRRQRSTASFAICRPSDAAC